MITKARYIENNGAGFKAVYYYSIIEGRMNCQHSFFQELQDQFCLKGNLSNGSFPSRPPGDGIPKRRVVMGIRSSVEAAVVIVCRPGMMADNLGPAIQKETTVSSG